ncbi:hypothetical protein F3Y22_tig00001869pilonHSYRG00004 [Hibiscus syriacus]|uniref:Uncharacterized protein n=1 Tax=Hibiscus syriacus TaxID=106335 RepID=A0A6A3CTX2_HIBSY|nr:hypothetical protein F3Y22_tig00001869pilonHSYRG00004 [Hibiscus syriacus]
MTPSPVFVSDRSEECPLVSHRTPSGDSPFGGDVCGYGRPSGLFGRRGGGWNVGVAVKSFGSSSGGVSSTGFLERTQDHPQSHHFLMELPAQSLMEDKDLDLGNAHDDGDGEEVEGCSLRDKEENLLRKAGNGGCFFDSV